MVVVVEVVEVVGAVGAVGAALPPPPLPPHAVTPQITELTIARAKYFTPQLPIALGVEVSNPTSFCQARTVPDRGLDSTTTFL